MSDLETLARELWQARRDGHTIPVPAEAPSLAEAYREQEAIAPRWKQAGSSALAPAPG